MSALRGYPSKLLRRSLDSSQESTVYHRKSGRHSLLAARAAVPCGQASGPAVCRNPLAGSCPRIISEELEELHQRSNSPAQRLEHELHALVSFGIIPLFAFANTSQVIAQTAVRGLLSPLELGILARLVDKPLSIAALSCLTVQLRCRLA
jgi:Na+/H+ antiporter NhaA